MKCEKTGRWTILMLKDDGVSYGQFCTACQEFHDVSEDKIIQIDEVKLCSMCRQELQKSRNRNG